MSNNALLGLAVQGVFYLLVELPVSLLWDRLGSLSSSVSLSLLCILPLLVPPNPLHCRAFLSSLTPCLVPYREDVGKQDRQETAAVKARGTRKERKGNVKKRGQKSVDSLRGAMLPCGHIWSQKD